MFPSGLCVVVGRFASRRGRLAARRGTMVLGIMGGMEPEGRLGARCVLAWWREGRLAARRGTIVLGIVGGMEPVGRLGARRGTITALGLMGGMEGGQTAFGMTAVRVPAHRHLRVPWNHGQRREMLVTKGAEVAF